MATIDADGIKPELPETGPTAKRGSWKTTAALTAGMGMPLGLLLVANPAAADGRPDDGNGPEDSQRSSYGGNSDNNDHDNNNQDINDTNFAGSSSYTGVTAQSSNITSDNFDITATHENFVETASANTRSSSSGSDNDGNGDGDGAGDGANPTNLATGRGFTINAVTADELEFREDIKLDQPKLPQIPMNFSRFEAEPEPVDLETKIAQADMPYPSRPHSEAPPTDTNVATPKTSGRNQTTSETKSGLADWATPENGFSPEGVTLTSGAEGIVVSEAKSASGLGANQITVFGAAILAGATLYETARLQSSSIVYGWPALPTVSLKSKYTGATLWTSQKDQWRDSALVGTPLAPADLRESQLSGRSPAAAEAENPTSNGRPEAAKDGSLAFPSTEPSGHTIYSGPPAAAEPDRGPVMYNTAGGHDGSNDEEDSNSAPSAELYEAFARARVLVKPAELRVLRAHKGYYDSLATDDSARQQTAHDEYHSALEDAETVEQRLLEIRAKFPPEMSYKEIRESVPPTPLNQVSYHEFPPVYRGETPNGSTIEGEISEVTGFIEFSLRSQEPGDGTKLFNEMLDGLKGTSTPIAGIRGVWVKSDSDHERAVDSDARGHGRSTNFEAFDQAIKRGWSPKEAALQTPTGKWASRAGFGQVEDPDIRSGMVIVHLRPDNDTPDRRKVDSAD